MTKGQEKVKVLLVDNNRDFVHLLSIFLEKEGYQVMKAYDGAEALEVVRTSPPDYIVLDLVMPKIDGGRVCHYLKLDQRFQKIPIIILSGVAAEVSSQMFEIGADAYIAKGNFEDLKRDILGTLQLFQGKSWMASIRRSILGVEKMHPREIVNELLMANDHQETVLQNLAEGVLEVDAGGKIIYVNPAACQILGLPEHELIVQPLTSVLDDHFRREVERIVKKFKISSSPARQTLTLPHRGKTLRVHFSNILENLQFAGYSVIIEDITPLMERIQELSLLSEIGIVLTSTLDLKAVLGLVIAKVKEALDVEAGSLLLASPDRTSLTFAVALGERWQSLQGKEFKADGLWGRMMQTGESILIPEAERDGRFDPVWDRESGFTTRSTLFVPLLTRGEAVGIVQVSNKRGGAPLTEEDRDLLSSISRYAAIAIDNARLYDQQKAMNENLKAMQEKLLESERLKAMADLAGATVQEFRQPLKSIQSRMDSLLRSLDEGHPAYSQVKELTREIGKLSDTIRHIEKITKMRQIVEKEGQRGRKRTIHSG
jgi:PAS domain S-box-containing protein